MPPALAMSNRVADAVKTLLAAIDGTGSPNTWRTTPRTVERLLPPHVLSIGPKPAIGVQVLSWNEVPVMGSRHELTLRIGVHLVADDAVSAEVVLNDLARDVAYQVMSDETLGGLVQFISNGEYEAQNELMLTHALAYALMTFTCKVTIEHAAP